MLQLWKQHVGAEFNVFAALSAAQPVKSLQGWYSQSHMFASPRIPGGKFSCNTGIILA